MATSEQNEAIGKFELTQLERKMKLLKEVRGESRWSAIIDFAFYASPGVIALVSMKFFEHNYAMVFSLCLLPVIAAIGRTAVRAHARLNALIKLVGEENLLGEKK